MGKPMSLFDDDADRAAAERDRIGNTPECPECGESLENCECDDDEPCIYCGCSPCSCDEPCEDCGEIECVCEGEPTGETGSLFDSQPQQSSLTKEFDRQSWEANQARRAELASNPRIIADALPGFQSIMREFDAAMRAGDLERADELHKKAQSYAGELQNGDRSGCKLDDGAETLLSEAAAAPDGALPMWGQQGNFVLRVGLTRIRFEVDGIFGIWNAFNFSIHAVDWHKPFPSETGYRSFCGISIQSIPQEWSVADWLTATVKAHISKEYKKGLPFIGMDYQDRHGHEVCELPTIDGDRVEPDKPFQPVKYQPEPYIAQKLKANAAGPAIQLGLFGGAA